ncbi:MAG: CsgG/HfaB family protein [Caulobacteraceae bacterium]
MRFHPLFAPIAAVLMAACAYVPKPAQMTKLPVFPRLTDSEAMLLALPPPSRAMDVAVYGFTDQTGQFKNLQTTQTLSRAVSQGGGAMLIRSLEEAGNRSWFRVVEREQLKDLLNERQIIRQMRAQYLGEKGVNPQALPPLLFAGVLLEGGVVGYDTDTVTGGLGASLLGIGADAKYQQDTVTVYLRAVSVKTGEVLASITASKTITSYALDANIFRYVGVSTLLETEDGFTTNEPVLLCLQQAIDKAVYGLVMEGVDLKLWSFADPTAAWPMLWRYNQERDGILSAQQVIDAERRGHRNFSHIRPALSPPTSSTASSAGPAPSAMNEARRPSPAPSPDPVGPLAAAAPKTRPSDQNPILVAASQPHSNSSGDKPSAGETSADPPPPSTR